MTCCDASLFTEVHLGKLNLAGNVTDSQQETEVLEEN
jgi:hypothetical protein